MRAAFSLVGDNTASLRAADASPKEKQRSFFCFYLHSVPRLIPAVIYGLVVLIIGMPQKLQLLLIYIMSSGSRFCSRCVGVGSRQMTLLSDVLWK